MPDLHEELKKFRKQRKLTQSELAKLSGLSQRDVSNFENKRTDTRLSTIEQLAQALDLRLMLIPKLRVVGVSELINKEYGKTEEVTNEPPSLLEQYGVSDDED